ncbi:hypothetical protein [Vibrio sp. F74]|uniref:hypothetical protein n=1 Tax=Vibrio sp. F74 TaxID=700020 RepID=UPI0035F5FBC1
MRRRDVLKVTVATAVGAAATLTNGSVLAQSQPGESSSTKFKNIIVTREKGILILRINKLPRNEVSQITLNELNIEK